MAAKQHITAGGMRRRNMYLPEDLMEEVKALADRKGLTMTDVVRTALEKYLQAVKKAEAAREQANGG